MKIIDVCWGRPFMGDVECWHIADGCVDASGVLPSDRPWRMSRGIADGTGPQAAPAVQEWAETLISATGDYAVVHWDVDVHGGSVVRASVGRTPWTVIVHLIGDSSIEIGNLTVAEVANARKALSDPHGVITFRGGTTEIEYVRVAMIAAIRAVRRPLTATRSKG